VIKGVNLGNWLVLEKWMSPGLFAGTQAADETQLCSDLGAAGRERLAEHRDTFITEEDFAYLASRGIDAVRIPVPFFVFGGYPPYVGCIEYLDRAFDWAESHDIKVLIDLHTVPDSQNGFDNGGMCGVCKWHKNPAHVEFALTVLERLTRRYRARPALWGIGVLNEPIAEWLWEAIDLPRRYPPRDPEYARGSEPVPTGFLKEFYAAAYRRIRAQSADVTIVFHDGFRIREWDGFFADPGFERIIVDAHFYLMGFTPTTEDGKLREYLGYIRDEFGLTVREMSRQFPLIVGEWCLEPMTVNAAALPQHKRLEFYRSLAQAQLAAWEGATGWFFWSFKLHVDGHDLDGWSLRTSIERGYLPVTSPDARRPPAAGPAPRP
jgi:glucan 1,3-beta-glucosidase